MSWNWMVMAFTHIHILRWKLNSSANAVRNIRQQLFELVQICLSIQWQKKSKVELKAVRFSVNMNESH